MPDTIKSKLKLVGSGAPSGAPSGPPPHPDMVWIPGGTFDMGSNDHYPEERPIHRVGVDGFWMDRYPVTNERFRRFVEATGHVTFAEIPPNPADYPGALRPSMLYAGSLVFVKPSGPVDLGDFGQLVDVHARRRLAAPDRPEELDRRAQAPSGRARHLRRRRGVRRHGRARSCRPRRSGSSPPAAASRGPSTPGATRWRRDGRHMANTWQGEFPWQNLLGDGYEGTSPVGRLPPERLRPLDMIGNVWEWTTDWYRPRITRRRRQGVLHPQQSARRNRGGELRPVPAGHPHPAQGAQGRLAPLRAQLLPALPAGGALPGADRHVHLPRRLPLRGACEAGGGVRGGHGATACMNDTWPQGQSRRHGVPERPRTPHGAAGAPDQSFDPDPTWQKAATE